MIPMVGPTLFKIALVDVPVYTRWFLLPMLFWRFFVAHAAVPNISRYFWFWLIFVALVWFHVVLNGSPSSSWIYDPRSRSGQGSYLTSFISPL